MRPFHSKLLDRAEVDSLVSERLAWILEAAEPTGVVVFGSAGRYEMREDSDLDLLVVLPDGVDASAVASTVLSRRPPNGVPADILFYGETEFTRRATLGGVCHVAAREGRVIHGRLPKEPESA